MIANHAMAQWHTRPSLHAHFSPLFETASKYIHHIICTPELTYFSLTKFNCWSVRTWLLLKSANVISAVEPQPWFHSESDTPAISGRSASIVQGEGKAVFVDRSTMNVKNEILNCPCCQELILPCHTVRTWAMQDPAERRCLSSHLKMALRRPAKQISGALLTIVMQVICKSVVSAVSVPAQTKLFSAIYFFY